MKLKKIVNVKFNNIEKDFLDVVITKEKTTLSEYIRNLVVKEMNKPENEYIIEFIKKIS